MIIKSLIQIIKWLMIIFWLLKLRAYYCVFVLWQGEEGHHECPLTYIFTLNLILQLWIEAVHLLLPKVHKYSHSSLRSTSSVFTYIQAHVHMHRHTPSNRWPSACHMPMCTVYSNTCIGSHVGCGTFTSIIYSTLGLSVGVFLYW